MNEYTIQVPRDNNLETWFFFLQKSLNINQNVDELTVSFYGVQFMEHDDFVMLACLIEHFHQRGSKIFFKGFEGKFKGFIHNVKFEDYWKDGFNRNNFTTSRNNTTLCLWKISEEMISTYSNYAKMFFSNFEQNKDLSGVGLIFEELFNNVFNHSKSHIDGYIMAQYYPKSNTLCFSICDFGVGIPYTVNNYLKENGDPELSDCDAISQALEYGFSIQSVPRNRGWGLSSVDRLIKNTNGYLLITSNYGIIEKSDTNDYIKTDFDTYFKGTLIKLEIKLDNLDDKEEEELNMEF